MNALQIKCYLISEPSKDMIAKSTEIRRFVLAPSDTGFYEKLIEKIQSAYGRELLPERDEVKTYWLDEENELVCFSTDPELHYAVDLMTAIRMSESSRPYNESSLFKVYVVRRVGEKRREEKRRWRCAQEKMASASGSGEEASGDELHLGVVCDGCNGQVKGIR